MAEFCLDCLRELDGISYRREEFVLSHRPELCEGCGQFKRVVIAKRNPSLFSLLGDFIAALTGHDD